MYDDDSKSILPVLLLLYTPIANGMEVVHAMYGSLAETLTDIV